MDINEGRLFIDGEPREASGGRRFEVIDPSDESGVGTAADATAEDVAAAVTAARTAFDTTSWSADHAFRKRCLQQLQEGLRKEVAGFKELNIAEAGLCASIGGLIDGAIEEMSFAMDLIDAFTWEAEFPPYEFLGMRSLRTVRYEPYGVVGAITPWNAPTMLNLWKLVPALATGNTVVLKTAPETPLAGTALARVIAEQTDIPHGVVNIYSSSDNAVGGDGLTGDPRVDMFHFTGIAQTEVFGPVLSVLKYSGGDDEAVRIANNTMYGLSGYVQTRDVERGKRIARRMWTGTVSVNSSIHNSPDTPFGGYGASGLGREHGIDGWREFLQAKTIATPA